MTNFDDVLASLDKDTRALLRRGNEFNKEILPTISVGLNNMLGGGLRKGKQHTFWGGEQSTKSSVLMQTIALNQALTDAKVAWIDAEHSWDDEWASSLGVDIEHVAVSETSTIAQVTDMQVKLIEAGFEIIVIDSTSALMPKSFFDDGEMKSFDNTGQIGQVAKDLGTMCKMVQGMNYTAAVVHISQLRNDLGNQFRPGLKPVGGKEVEHTDSFRVRFSSTTSDSSAIMGKIEHGNKLLEERVGREVRWTINKNKINGRFGKGKFDFYFKGDHLGLDRAGELLDYGLLYGLVEQGGSWITVGDQKVQGRDKAVELVRSNEELAKELEHDITKSV